MSGSLRYPHGDEYSPRRPSRGTSSRRPRAPAGARPPGRRGAAPRRASTPRGSETGRRRGVWRPRERQRTPRATRGTGRPRSGSSWRPPGSRQTSPGAAPALRQKSTSPFTGSTSRSSSQASSVDALNVTEHVSLAKEAFEDQTLGPSLDQTGSYLRWNQNVESMMNCPEPREDFTQLPVCTTPSFDRGLN